MTRILTTVGKIIVVREYADAITFGADGTAVVTIEFDGTDSTMQVKLYEAQVVWIEDTRTPVL